MKKIVCTQFILALAATSAFAADTVVTTNTDTNTTVSSGVTYDEPNATGLNNEMVGITPQLGVINMKTLDGTQISRGLIGMTLDVNGTGFVNRTLGMGYTNVYSGITLGALYSHVGSQGANFVGDNDGSANGGAYGGANMAIIPANVKIGYSFGNFLAAVHGGGNVFYQSIASSTAVGINATVSNASAWSFLPNAGLDLQYGVNNKIAVLLRPDWTMAGSNSMVSATLGATFPI
jgi:hypothetical protein